MREYVKSSLVAALILLAPGNLSFAWGQVPQDPHEFFGSDSRIQVNYFDIEGDSLPTLRDSMKRLGPKDVHGIVRYAFTDWYIGWTLGQREDGTIDPSRIKVNYSATVLLPRLKNSENASSELRKYWANFIDALLLHEKGHIDICRKRYYEVERALRTAVFNDRSITKDELEKIGKRQVTAIHADDIVYDQQTRNGFTQGVTLFREEMTQSK